MGIAFGSQSFANPMPASQPPGKNKLSSMFVSTLLGSRRRSSVSAKAELLVNK